MQYLLTVGAVINDSTDKMVLLGLLAYTKATPLDNGINHMTFTIKNKLNMCGLG